MSTVEQIPEASIESGVPFDWSDLASYAARLDQLDVLINHAFLIGHVPLRAAVLGVPGVPTPAGPPPPRSPRWAVCCARGLELGALGFSTDQVVGNPGPGGTALPGQVCGEDELLGLAAVLGQGPGPGLFTMANAALLLGPGGADGRPATGTSDWRRPRGARWSSGRSSTPPTTRAGAAAIMDLALAGRRAGVTVVPQISTRPFELWTRLDSAGHAGAVAALAARPPSRAAAPTGVRALAADPEARAQLRREGAAMPPNPVFNGRWDHVRVRYSHQPGVEGKDLGGPRRGAGLRPGRPPARPGPGRRLRDPGGRRSCATATTTRWPAWSPTRRP